jgi:heat shock protein HtpX
MLPVFGLYSHIRANRIRSALLLGALFFLVYVVIFAMTLLADGLIYDNSSRAFAGASRHFVIVFPFASAILVVWVLFAARFNQSIVGITTGAREPTADETKRIAPLIEEMCISRGMSAPRIEVLDTEALNAFATGMSEKQYTITVTTGLIEALDDREIRAVLGHELTHIRNEDVRLMVMAIVIAGVISFFAEFVFRMLDGASWSSSSSKSSDSKDSGGGFAIVVALALLALAWVLSLAVRLGLSRTREYLADAGSVELTKDPDAMISALRKIDKRGEIEKVPSGVMEMCLDNPRSGFADLFSTHPSIEARIEALEAYAGGRDERTAKQPTTAPERLVSPGHAPGST